MFLRKYYENGSHAVYILYLTDPAQSEADIDTLRGALKNAKGPGNFRNLFVCFPNGKKDGLQLFPVSEVASLRIPPQLMGILPQNAGGFGAIKEAAEVRVENELEVRQSRLKALNEWAGTEMINFLLKNSS